MLDKINSPEDLKKLNYRELTVLCEEIRTFLLENVSKTGGHLSSNLGVVELSVILHMLFNSPHDKIIFDVGHQSYVHKILTGRMGQFSSLRSFGGLSGFQAPDESEHDIFSLGHCSTSISMGLGLSAADMLDGGNNYIVSIIGDGSMTGGLAYEGLNNAGIRNGRYIIILNDNEMSISKNVGALPRYLSKIRIKPWYLKFKIFTKRFLTHIPLIGKWLAGFIEAYKVKLKNYFYQSTMFEQMGLIYVGPVDGHSIRDLNEAITQAKAYERPVLLHICTVKGKGYDFTEQNADDYHGVGKFDPVCGYCPKDYSFSNHFGKALTQLADADDKICAITAAMCKGTCVEEFSNKYPNRVFDVGIAEQHAVSFAAGLSKSGYIPIFAVYSTFLQRTYDQLLHDISLQNLRLVLAIDRAGLTGEDGKTHHGIFDVAMLSHIPNITIFSPVYYNELENMLQNACYDENGITAIRYPRGCEPSLNDETIVYQDSDISVYGTLDCDISIMTYGKITKNVLDAKYTLQRDGIYVNVIRLKKIFPIPKQALQYIGDKLLFVEEGIKVGGIGMNIASILNKSIEILAIKDFVPHGDIESLYTYCGFDSDNICEKIKLLNERQ